MTLALAAAPALAQAPAPRPAAESAKDEARSLADEGEKLFQAGDYKTAVLRLRQADSKFPAPTIKLLLAEVHEKLGQLVEAQALYRRVAGEKLSTATSAEFREAQATAAAAVARLDKAIPRLELVVVGDPVNVAMLVLDGEALSAEALSEPVRVNPGIHSLQIQIVGAALETRSVSVREGEMRRVVINTTAPAAAPAAEAPSVPAPGAGPSYAGPVSAFAVSAAGLVTGVVAGGLALSKMGGFREQCGPELQCPQSFQGELNGARVMGHVSTVGFAVAGVGAALGATFLVWQAKGGKASAGVRVGPLGGAVTGVF